jgi:hypothetical protein
MVFNGLDAAQIEFELGHGHAHAHIFAIRLAITLANPYGNSPSKQGTHGTNQGQSICSQHPSPHGRLA